MEEQLLSLLEKFLTAVVELVERRRHEGGQRAVLGAVAGRSLDEDVEIGIDRACEELFREHLRAFCRDKHIAVQVYSEHGTYRIGRGKVAYLCAIDPFDGSGLFQRGWPAEWFSVLSIYTPKGMPIVGGMADILRREVFLADASRKQVLLCDLERQAKKLVGPSLQTAIDNNTKLAAYLMDPSYTIEWVHRMRLFFASSPKPMPPPSPTFLFRLWTWLARTLGISRSAQPPLTLPGIRIWPNGGSCIYAWLAMGRVDAYVMFNEPRSEIDPALAFVAASDLALFSVEDDGTLVPYVFEPGKQADRVPFFIAACNARLAQDIVRLVMGS